MSLFTHNSCATTSVSRRAFSALAAGAVASAFAFGLVACSATTQSSTDQAADEDTTITVAASPTPHAEILNTISDELAAEGYTLEVKEFTDYVLPNTATEEGEVDANFFQHGPYLEDFNAEQGTHLVSVGEVHFEPFGLYSEKVSSLDDLADGAVVAVPNDATNEARALLLLEQEGLIKLDEEAGITATPKDIVENPKNLEFRELEAATVPNFLSEVDLAAINGNYAQGAGLSVSDALATESDEGLAAQTYANLLVVKEGSESDEKIQALYKALTSDTAREFIDSEYEGAVVALF